MFILIDNHDKSNNDQKVETRGVIISSDQNPTTKSGLILKWTKELRLVSRHHNKLCALSTIARSTSKVACCTAGTAGSQNQRPRSTLCHQYLNEEAARGKSTNQQYLCQELGGWSTKNHSAVSLFHSQRLPLHWHISHPTSSCCAWYSECKSVLRHGDKNV